MKTKKSFCALCLAVMAVLFAPLPATANNTDLLDMSDKFDELDKQDFQAAIDMANGCIRVRNFTCAESELAKAKKSANSGKDKKTLLASSKSLVNERQALADELKRAEEARQAQIRRQEEERQAEGRREEQRQAQRRRDEQEAEDRQSSRSNNQTALNQIQNQNSDLMQVMKDHNAWYANQQTKIAADKAAKQQARDEQDARDAQRRRDAAREQADRAEAQRAARARAVQSQPDLPKYQPQVVVIPQGDLVCPPGSTWYDASGTGAKGGTCYKNSQVPGQNQVASNSVYGSNSSSGSGSNSGSNSNRQSSTSGTSSRQQTSSSSGSDAQSDQTSSTTTGKKPPKVEWGPVTYEALAICHKTDKGGKWGCDGPLQDDIIYDSPTVEDALSTVGCTGGTYAGGGKTNKGKSADVYYCGYGLRSYDTDIKKKHGLITAQKAYMCPKYQDKCTDIYDGQDRR
jgi:hypothetical protein